jgi:MYXO-CTERM domain-containing protein
MRPQFARRFLHAAVLLTAGLLTASANASTLISSSLSGKAGDQFTSTLSVTNLSFFEAGDFLLTFDAALLTLKRVDLGSLTGDFSILATDPPIAHLGDSLVDVIVGLSAGLSGVTGDGSLFAAVFELNTDATATVDLLLDITDLGFSADITQVGVVNDTTPPGPSAVPITNTGALALLGLAALAFTRRQPRHGQL